MIHIENKSVQLGKKELEKPRGKTLKKTCSGIFLFLEKTAQKWMQDKAVSITARLRLTQQKLKRMGLLPILTHLVVRKPNS